MDLKRKLQLLDANIKSISEHDDEDADVRKAVLNKAIEMIEGEKAAIDVRAQKRLVALGVAPAA